MMAFFTCTIFTNVDNLLMSQPRTLLYMLALKFQSIICLRRKIRSQSKSAILHRARNVCLKATLPIQSSICAKPIDSVLIFWGGAPSAILLHEYRQSSRDVKITPAVMSGVDVEFWLWHRVTGPDIIVVHHIRCQLISKRQFLISWEAFIYS